jgi:integrase
MSYVKAEPRSVGDTRRINRILGALRGDVPLAAMTQARVDEVRDKLLKPGASPATVRRGIIVPIRAILMHAHRRGWCGRPIFEIPRQPAGRTRYLLPAEAERLIAAAAPHLRPLFVMLLCTGARLAEALELEWREVDLHGRRVTFWTKGNPRRRRVVELPLRAVTVLFAQPHREGRVFRWETKPSIGGRVLRSSAYADNGREYGGQIKRGWAGALRRSGLADLSPHDLRHTWATWHYAIHRDPLKLKVDGQWSSVALVERYAHLMPEGHGDDIRAFWQGTQWSSRAAKQAAIEEKLKEHPELSDRAIAKETGTSHPTVATIRAKAEANGKFSISRIEASGRPARGHRPSRKLQLLKETDRGERGPEDDQFRGRT